MVKCATQTDMLSAKQDIMLLKESMEAMKKSMESMKKSMDMNDSIKQAESLESSMTSLEFGEQSLEIKKGSVEVMKQLEQGNAPASTATTIPTAAPAVPREEPAYKENRNFLSGLAVDDIGVFHPYKSDAANREITAPVQYESSDDGTFVTFVSVDSFISRLNDLISAYGPTPLRIMIPLTLRGESRLWFEYELLEADRNTLRGDPSSNLDLWKAALKKRFAVPSHVALRRLTSRRYRVADAKSGKSIRAFFNELLTSAREVGCLTPEIQLHLIYNSIDVELQIYLEPPTKKTSIESYREHLTVQGTKFRGQMQKHSTNMSLPMYNRQIGRTSTT